MEQQKQMSQQQTKQMEQAKQQQERKAQYEEWKEQVLNTILDLSAKDRLSRIKLVKPERAQQIEQYLIQQSKSQGFQNKISEDELIGLLEQINQQKTESKITIQRKQRGGLDDSF